jgi:hypothetical protein
VSSDVIDERSTPARGAGVYTVELDGEAVLLDQDNDRLHLLNQTGTLLWLLYDGRTSLGELAGELASELVLDRDQVLVDIVAITTQLADERLLT